MAHEWVHHYLAFYPLGVAYRSSPELTTINETVANIAGRELASAMRERLELLAEPQPAVRRQGSNPAGQLRELRREVDALLAGGDIAGAERRMEEVRQELAGRGLALRRLNQAYLAFHNLYADSPPATDPLGPALLRLRALSADLAAFMRTVRGVTSAGEVYAALDRAEAQTRIAPPHAPPAGD
jgi:hypothetical protein